MCLTHVCTCTYSVHLQLHSNNTKHLEINCTFQIRCSVVTVVVWLEDDDMGEGLVFFLELAEGLDDIQDLPSTMILYQRSVDKTIQVNQTCLKLKISTLLTYSDSFLKMSPVVLQI